MWEYIVGGIVAATVGSAVVRAGWQLALPKIRGNAGEATVNRCLKKFRGKGFARSKDVMIPVRDKTSQIDNILVSRYGIFVIETKNYSGRIVGSEQDANWKQIYSGRNQKSRSFYNPIWQNKGHIRALKNLLNQSFPDLKYHNIVAFSDDCKPPRIPGVVTFRQLRKTLKQEMKGEPILSEQDVAAIQGIIEKYNITDRSKRAEHVAYAKDAAAQAKERKMKEAIRDRAEKDKGSAMRAQELYWQGRSEKVAEKAPLDEQVFAAQNDAGKSVPCGSERGGQRGFGPLRD